MQCNVGSVDRNLRIFVGAVIIAVGVYMQSWWGLIGLVPIVTAIANFCPAYTIFGLSTCKKETDETEQGQS
ncbi:YgaP family membrane protein [Thiomicrorhabdus sediminis]|uniref:DUF2892 domain-containing protein n=1 Tax=Thiomicrorhabdus sediminis TaxID=2580412 RepID=A0A4P9K633_9GAMM|nr:DUF2892 domain-containing protein [Thiomicrorhabdus sediminis]QCU89717.1 DUF2892 domain-containing protein [Thiomicrorhabdus sediminis]